VSSGTCGEERDSKNKDHTKKNSAPRKNHQKEGRAQKCSIKTLDQVNGRSAKKWRQQSPSPVEQG